ncbi:unnamed protein product [Lactuca virosa]|uniref:AAA+ ATPase domain-containing protein n=1 Tax=Lactuca virosa TaxID=75947 RepID=A0AAU9MQR8_9ASTR|nr:unnamed protein product [Lactuca virosa]
MRKRKPSKKHLLTFDDVEGADAAKAELLENFLYIVSCIKKDSMKLGAKLPRGVFLTGPPGTGKTLLAPAVAGEAGVTFFSISASELAEVYVRAGAARVRELFREARKRSPSIIFIDEIDVVGGECGSSSNSKRDQTLNQLLTEMDGFVKSANVVVIAATNRPESLDSTLMRPGRFSRKVVVGEPDEDGRRNIFGLYMEEVPMKEEDKDDICDLVASLTPGLVGADIEYIANESVLLAARRDGDFVTKEDVLQAVERATTRGRGRPIKKYQKLYNFFLEATLTLNKKILQKSYTSLGNLKGCRSTTNICNDDSSPESKSLYLFGQMALEMVTNDIGKGALPWWICGI